MGLSLSTTTAGNHKVVAVAGDLAATKAEELRGELRLLLNDGACDLAANIDRVEHSARTSLVAIRLRDHWELLWHSIVQLVLRTSMIAQAGTQQIYRRYPTKPGTCTDREPSKTIR